MIEAQLKKGILEICILKLLLNNDEYGYPIIQKLTDLFEGVSVPTLYSIMRRLEKNKYTEAYYSDVSKGPKRKYYKITKKGEEYFNNALYEWNSICEAMRKMDI